MGEDEITAAYPYLEKDDIRQCLLYAAALVQDDSYHLVGSAE
jgi:uncharacterized protein (DUF433 family)